MGKCDLKCNFKAGGICLSLTKNVKPVFEIIFVSAGQFSLVLPSFPHMQCKIHKNI